MTALGGCCLEQVGYKPLYIVVALGIEKRIVAHGFFHVDEIKHPHFISLCFQQLSGITQDLSLWVKHHKAGIALHDIRLGIKSRFTRTRTADHKGIEISAMLVRVIPDLHILRQDFVHLLWGLAVKPYDTRCALSFLVNKCHANRARSVFVIPAASLPYLILGISVTKTIKAKEFLSLVRSDAKKTPAIFQNISSILNLDLKLPEARRIFKHSVDVRPYCVAPGSAVLVTEPCFILLGTASGMFDHRQSVILTKIVRYFTHFVVGCFLVVIPFAVRKRHAVETEVIVDLAGIRMRGNDNLKSVAP